MFLFPLHILLEPLLKPSLQLRRSGKLHLPFFSKSFSLWENSKQRNGNKSPMMHFWGPMQPSFLTSLLKCPHRGLAFDDTGTQPSSCMAYHHPSPRVHKTCYLSPSVWRLRSCSLVINLHLFAFSLIWSDLLCQQKHISMGNHEGRWGLTDLSLSPKWPQHLCWPPSRASRRRSGDFQVNCLTNSKMKVLMMEMWDHKGILLQVSA